MTTNRYARSRPPVLPLWAVLLVKFLLVIAGAAGLMMVLNG